MSRMSKMFRMFRMSKMFRMFRMSEMRKIRSNFSLGVVGGGEGVGQEVPCQTPDRPQSGNSVMKSGLRDPRRYELIWNLGLGPQKRVIYVNLGPGPQSPRNSQARWALGPCVALGPIVHKLRLGFAPFRVRSKLYKKSCFLIISGKKQFKNIDF